MEKKSDQKVNSLERSREDSKQRILLKDLHLHWEKDVNLFVQVHTKTSIASKEYILMRVSDSSGSTYIEFNLRARLENKGWYCLKDFKVFGDKQYGYIASQQK